MGTDRRGILKPAFVAILLLCAASACQNPILFPLVQKYQSQAGDLFYFQSPVRFVLLERRKAFDIAVSAGGLHAYSYPDKITISRPVGEHLENTPFTETAIGMQKLTFSPTGAFLAGGALDGTVTVWDLTTGHIPLSLQEPARVTSLAFSPDGLVLAVGISTPAVVQSGTVRLWEMQSRRLLSTYGNSQVTALAYSRDGRLAVGFADGSVELHTGRQDDTFETRISSAVVTALAFHSEGQVLAVAYSNKEIQLWNTVTGQFIAILSSEVPANPLVPRAIERIAFSPDGSRLAAAYEDGEQRIWDVSALNQPRK